MKTNNFQTVIHLVSVSVMCLDLGQLGDGIESHCPMRVLAFEPVSSDQTLAGSLKLKIILRTLCLTRVANWWPLSVNFQIFCPHFMVNCFVHSEIPANIIRRNYSPSRGWGSNLALAIFHPVLFFLQDFSAEHQRRQARVSRQSASKFSHFCVSGC